MEIQGIRSLLSQGEIGKSLEGLIALAKQDRRYKDNILRTLFVLEGEYNAVRQKELKGILSFQEAQREYNETNDALLAILDDIEAGRVPAAESSSASQFRNIGLALIGGGVLLFGIAMLWITLRNAESVCPTYDNQKALHVLVIPFDPLSSDTAPIHLRVQEDITRLTQNAEIPVEVKIGSRTATDVSSLQLANRQGKQCKADLVIYGQYKKFMEDSIRVNLGYSFLQEGNKKTGSVPFKTFRDITDVKVTRGLEDALYSLCSMIAVQHKNWPAAKRWMDKIQEKDANEEKMTEWLAEQKTIE